MSLKVLFVPGLFVTPQSRKFAALRDAMSDHDWSIVDFSPLYKRNMRYHDFVDKTQADIRSIEPDVIVTYSFGAQLYHNLVGEKKISEAKKTVSIVPIGQYDSSGNGSAILAGHCLAADIYAPINQLRIAGNIGTKFFRDLSADGQKHAWLQFQRDNYLITGSLDQDADPTIVSRFKDQNYQGHTVLRDDHRMTRNMPLVCSLTASFMMHG